MILETTLNNLDEFVYKYTELLGWANGCEIQDVNNEHVHLGIANYRIQIPSLGLSLRSGDLLSQHGDTWHSVIDPKTGKSVLVETTPPTDRKWEVDACCVIICELNEKDMTKYLGWTTSSYQGAVYEYLYPKYKKYSDLDSIPCFVDTSDFMKDEEKAQKYAKECDVAYEKEMTENDEDEI